MEEPVDSVSIDMETIPFGGKEFTVETSSGPVSVCVCGDPNMPALITYPDVALDYISCFQGLLLHNFCIYQINAPGHELGEAANSEESPFFSVDDLAAQVAEVFDFFGVKKAICFGVLAGAYVISLFAIKYRERVMGLILVSPLCRAPSWTEWLYNKVLLILLYFYGVCGLFKELLLLRYFSEEVRCGVEGANSDVLQACRRLLDDRQRSHLIRFLVAINRRWDLSADLKDLECKTLIFAGSNSPFYSEALHMNKMMGCIAHLVELHGCGSLVTEEQPEAMLAPLERFLEGFVFFQQVCSLGPITSTVHISPEFLSAEAIGIKLKPIKTRA